MALQITKNITGVLGTLNVSSLYIRIQYWMDFSGNNILIHNKVFLDKTSYQYNLEDSVTIEGIPAKMVVNYDRDIDGNDTLGFCHNKVIDYLSTDQYEDVPVLDPSTGEMTYDPSTGDPITESVISIAKLCEPGEISVLDISIG